MVPGYGPCARSDASLGRFGAVLVTGATGFVGLQVVRTLLDDAHVEEVRCLTRKPTPELEQLAAGSPGRVKLCVGDMGDAATCRASVAPHLAGATGVINCAAHYRWWTRSPEQFHRLNGEAAGELAALAKQAGVRKFVQVSTILAVGSPGGGWGSAARPLQPDTPMGRPASRYAASKAAGDQAVLRVATDAAAPQPEAAVAAAASPEAGSRQEESKAAAEKAPGAGPDGGTGPSTSAAEGSGGGDGASSAGSFTACVVALGCVVGADRRLVAGGEEDVMRIADLVRGKVPATLGHETTFTYLGVRDAAAAIVAALHRGRNGRRYLIGNQRMTTGEYYQLIARLSGTPPPRQVVPVWLAAGWAHTAAALAALTGVPPQAPPDLIRTVAYGTLLYDSASSEAELGLALPYRDIAASFAEAVECVKRHDAELQGRAQ